MKDTKIQWCHHTFNGWWGCFEAGPERDNCYARTFANRLGLKLWGHGAERRVFGDKHWNEPLKWDRAAAKAGERHRVFCSSMADVLEDRRDLDAQRARLWALIEATPNLDWMLLTKRPAKFATLTPSRWLGAWPRNVWAGTSAGTQRTANILIPQLVRAAAGAAVVFVSGEPLLERVEYPLLGYAGVHLLILGGESGARGVARPLDPEWIRYGIAQARASGCAAFVKQMGRWVLGDHAGFRPDHFLLADGSGFVPPLLPSRWYRPTEAVGFSLHDSHGGDPAEWPEDLRVREFPQVAA